MRVCDLYNKHWHFEIRKAQGRIQDFWLGGSNYLRGVDMYSLTNFSWKSPWKWNNLDTRGVSFDSRTPSGSAIETRHGFNYSQMIERKTYGPSYCRILRLDRHSVWDWYLNNDLQIRLMISAILLFNAKEIKTHFTNTCMKNITVLYLYKS